MRYDVPFVSQYHDLADPEWQWRGCGIVALKMVLDYWHGRDDRNRTIGLDELHKKGLGIKAYKNGIGWSHAGLVQLGRDLGYEAYNRDWAPGGPTPKDSDAAWEALKLELKNGPVLGSVYSGFKRSRGGGHIVVLAGETDGLVFLNDPEERNEQEGRKAFAIPVFRKAFKRRYIVIRPRS